MKIPSLFSKTPKYKKFNYAPRFYDADEEERRDREERIKRELEAEHLKNSSESGDSRAAELEDSPAVTGFRSRIPGSFKMAKKSAKIQADPSANILRLIVLFVLVVGLIAFIEYGMIALYAAAFVFVPLYFYLKFRKPRR